MKKRNYNIEVFDQHTQEYDAWYNRHTDLYQSELLALKMAVPTGQNGVEIGAGTGRFALPLGIATGLEPSAGMAKLAQERGLKIFPGTAEALPFPAGSFDFALLTTTLCFLDDVPGALAEIHRILRPGGSLVIGMIDKNSRLGKKYEREKSSNKFYRNARFHSVEEAVRLLENAGFHHFEFWQTLTGATPGAVETPLPGYGVGSFAVIKSHKN
jgi:ubiquinone/menaquinone biosynthesis C-methylase UbiE